MTGVCSKDFDAKQVMIERAIKGDSETESPIEIRKCSENVRSGTKTKKILD